MRRLIYGVGVNDADYMVQPIVNGKQVRCPYYRAWTGMLRRVYSNKFHAIQPTYEDTTVCSEWHSFMTFRAWMMKQDWENKQLDKDILHPNNKHYSPENCCFVSSALNKLLTDAAAGRGQYKIGVSFYKQRKKFCPCISIYGKTAHLGCYLTEEEAHAVYKEAKRKYIKTFYPHVSKRIKEGLKRHVKLLK